MLSVKSDDRFTARMRFHQGYYRRTVLKVPPGVGPTRDSTNSLENMLRYEDGLCGLNFLTPSIFMHAKARLKHPGVVEEFRLLCNMLSSQPMCFNLFAPLKDDQELACAFVSTIESVKVDRVTRVEIEYAPTPKSEYLNDRTAFDAFIEYEASGKLCFIGIETKLTEPFSPTEYPHTYEGYSRWLTGANTPFASDDWQSMTSTHTNQLWRDHLLVVAMLNHPHSVYSKGSLLLVNHPLDTKCCGAYASYQTHLKQSGWITQKSIKEVYSMLKEFSGSHHRQWLDELYLRYLGLEKSEEDWKNHQESGELAPL